MTDNNDFTWGKGRIIKEGNLGKIVAIPPETDTCVPEGCSSYPASDEGTDLEVDEFKKKMAERLSNELHRDEA